MLAWSHMENSEELAEPQRRLEKHAVFIFQVAFSALLARISGSI